MTFILVDDVAGGGDGLVQPVGGPTLLNTASPTTPLVSRRPDHTARRHGGVY